MLSGRLMSISKDKSDSTEIEKTRPISVLPIITIFLILILNILEDIVQSNKFCNFQRGFTKENVPLII